MIKLSEIIRTDCYIDCGNNEKLREVVKVLGLGLQVHEKHKTLQVDTELNAITPVLFKPYCFTTHHISQIDLNQ